MLYNSREFDYNVQAIWVWRSLVARMNGVHEAGSSSLLTQTRPKKHVKTLRAFCFAKKHAEVTRFFGLLRAQKMYASQYFVCKKEQEDAPRYSYGSLFFVLGGLLGQCSRGLYAVFLLIFLFNVARKDLACFLFCKKHAEVTRFFGLLRAGKSSVADSSRVGKSRGYSKTLVMAPRFFRLGLRLRR